MSACQLYEALLDNFSSILEIPETGQKLEVGCAGLARKSLFGSHLRDGGGLQTPAVPKSAGDRAIQGLWTRVWSSNVSSSGALPVLWQTSDVVENASGLEGF